MDQLTHVFVLLAALSSVGTAEDVYFADGDERTFEVRPPVTEKIRSIIWKIDGDRVLDWSDTSPLEVYRTFKTRTNLNTTNGRLVIKHMTKADMGRYTVEINDKVQSGNYDMKWIQRVNKPKVFILYSSDSEKCDVTCDGGTKEAEPIEYYWRIGSLEWKIPGKDFEITKEEHGGQKDITCWMKNPVSEAESEPINNPFYMDNSLPTWQIVGIILCVLGIVVLVLLCAMCKYEKGPFKNRVTSPGNALFIPPYEYKPNQISHPEHCAMKPRINPKPRKKGIQFNIL